MRHMPNLRMKARGRPQMPQRWCSCTRNFAGRIALATRDFLANVFVGYLTMPYQPLLPAADARWLFLCCLLPRLAEGEADVGEQGAALVVAGRGGDDAHLHAADAIDL